MNIESLNKKYASFIATFRFNVVLRIGTSKQRKLRYYKILSTDVMIFFFYRIATKIFGNRKVNSRWTMKDIRENYEILM